MLWKIQYEDGSEGWLEPGSGVLFDANGGPGPNPACYTTIDTEPEQPGWYSPPPPPEPEPAPFDVAAYMAACSAAVQEHLDAEARARMYDSILSAVSYQTSSHPKFGPEGRAFAAWRDDVWTYCYAALDDCTNGRRSIPTPEELVAELPPLVI